MRIIAKQRANPANHAGKPGYRYRLVYRLRHSLAAGASSQHDLKEKN
jgi:hypothetical protein